MRSEDDKAKADKFACYFEFSMGSILVIGFRYSNNVGRGGCVQPSKSLEIASISETGHNG